MEGSPPAAHHKANQFTSGNINVPLEVRPELSLPGAVDDNENEGKDRYEKATRHLQDFHAGEKQQYSSENPQGEKRRSSSIRRGSTGSLIEAGRSRAQVVPNQNHTLFARIANDERFQNVTLLIIVLNAVWIGIDTEWNHDRIRKERGDDKLPLSPTSDIIENAFCAYFFVEVVIRFLAFEKRCKCWRDGWFVFDTFLVFCMVVETWVLPIFALITTSSDGGTDFLSNFSALRLLRLLRLTRMMRLMRHVPELMMLVKGILSATQAVFFIMLFLLLVMYVFAIVFTSTIAEPGIELEEGYNAPYLFASMYDSMMTLFTNGVLGDNLADTVDALVQHSLVMMWMFFLFFFISSMTLLNMLIGVLCEVVSSEANNEKIKLEESGIRFVLEEAFETIDLNNDGKVSEAEWHQMKNDPDVRNAFIGAGLDENCIEEELEELKVGIFGKRSSHEGFVGFTLEELCNKVIEIRPGSPGSLLDLKRLEVRQDVRMAKLAREMKELENIFEEALRQRNLPIPRSPSPSRSASKSKHASVQALPTRALLHALKRRAAYARDIERQIERQISDTSVIDLTATMDVVARSDQASPQSQPPRVWFSEEPVPHHEYSQPETFAEQVLPPIPRLSPFADVSPFTEKKGSLGDLDDTASTGSDCREKHPELCSISELASYADSRGINFQGIACAPSSISQSSQSYDKPKHSVPCVSPLSLSSSSRNSTGSDALQLSSTYPAFELQSKKPATESFRNDVVQEFQDDGNLARHHPLFLLLRDRNPPGGWIETRNLAAQLQRNQRECISLNELCRMSRIPSVAELRSTLQALPELFSLSGTMVEIRCPEIHIPACPRHDGNLEGGSNLRCQCVWRLCDALQLYSETQADHNLPKTGSQNWCTRSPRPGVSDRGKNESLQLHDA